MSWKRFGGVSSTEAHQIAPELYTKTSRREYFWIGVLEMDSDDGLKVQERELGGA